MYFYLLSIQTGYLRGTPFIFRNLFGLRSSTYRIQRSKVYQESVKIKVEVNIPMQNTSDAPQIWGIPDIQVVTKNDREEVI